MSLKDKRKTEGLTQREAADLFGIHYRTYQNYENGVTEPDLDMAAKFARHFGCSIGELFDLGDSDIGLSPSETELIRYYRIMDEEGRLAIRLVARKIAELTKRNGLE